MSASDDFILILHAPDGGQWAKFISGRLTTPQYGIRSISKDMPTEAAEEASDIYSNQSIGSSSSLKDKADSKNTSKDDSKNDSNNNSGAQNSNRDSGRSSNEAITDLSSIKDCINNCRASVVLMSPDILESDLPFSVDVTSLHPRHTVFMFLGVDIEEVRSYFSNKSDHVFKCRCCVIDGSEPSICDAMCQIIEAYEDLGGGSVGDDEEEDIYNIPPSPKQLNKIEKVFPKELSEKERDVYVLLERPPEDDVIAVLDSAMSQEIPLTCVCDRLYKFTIPDDVKGEIFFKVECQSHCFGDESVRVFSNLDRVKAVLDEEVRPLSVLAKSMGLSPDDVGGVDTKLAFRLEQLASLPTFRKLFPCEDALSNTDSDERSELLYPSLLHFAADLNLRTFCSVLLRYPGMLAAACTENKDGEFPSQIAQRKGYTKLEADLMQFVEDNKRIVESEHENLYVEPSPPKPPIAHKPFAHKSLPGYVNQKSQDPNPNDNYIDMANLHVKPPLLDLQTQHSDTDLVSPISKSSDNVFSSSTTSFSSSRAEEEEEEQSDYQNVDELLDPKFTLWDEKTSPGSSFASDSPRSATTQDPLSSPGASSRKALKVLGVSEDEISRSRSNTLEPQWRSGGSSSDRDKTLTNVTHGLRYPAASQIYPSSSRMSVTSNCDDPAIYALYGQDTNKKAMKSKIKSFFGKIKSRRSNSDGELILSAANAAIKKSPSNRSERTGSARSRSDRKKSNLADTPEKERDSGSYSDEEKDKSSPLPHKKNKPKVFKEREKPMARRLSKRAQHALNDTVDDAPTLPRTEKRRGAFKSFVQDI